MRSCDGVVGLTPCATHCALWLDHFICGSLYFLRPCAFSPTPAPPPAAISSPRLCLFMFCVLDCCPGIGGISYSAHLPVRLLLLTVAFYTWILLGSLLSPLPAFLVGPAMAHVQIRPICVFASDCPSPSPAACSDLPPKAHGHFRFSVPQMNSPSPRSLCPGIFSSQYSILSQ